MSTEEELNEHLKDIRNIDRVKGSALVRRDGLMILSQLPDGIDSDQLAAMTASTVGSGETASNTLAIGNVEQVIVESKQGKLISTGVGEDAILAVITSEDIQMKDLLSRMSQKVDEVVEIL
ncbi:MAG: roadblock/LC7 domain-containing protein [Candidatus Nanohaloarchaea archaeon]|nr:roadblock/LC7 domain-containing protein [Candidatus Nanohaloarchaea archaeon]